MLNLNEYPPGTHLRVLVSNGRFATVIVSKAGIGYPHMLVVDASLYWFVDSSGVGRYPFSALEITSVLGPMTIADDKPSYSRIAVIFYVVACVAFVVLATFRQLCKFW